jgi:hypothetical protein
VKRALTAWPRRASIETLQNLVMTHGRAVPSLRVTPSAGGRASARGRHVRAVVITAAGGEVGRAGCLSAGTTTPPAAFPGSRTSVLMTRSKGSSSENPSLFRATLAALGAALVIQPCEPEVPAREPDVADVEPFVTTVSRGTDDTEETTATVGVLRTTTACQRVVS